MKENIDFLNVIFQNAQMGIIGIDDVFDKIGNQKLLEEMKSEKREYQKICKEAKKLIKDYGGEEKDINIMAKISSNIYSELKLMTDHNDEKIIIMMIEGSYKSLGILKTSEIEYKGAKKEVNNLLEKLFNLICQNIDNLKKLAKYC